MSVDSSENERHKMMRLGLVLLSIAVQPTQSVCAQNTTELDLQPLIDRSRNLFQIAPADDIRNTLKHQTIMRWANNSRGSQNGATMIWIKNGRPEAVCCIYPWQGQLRHEFDSLSVGLIRGMKDGSIVWRPEKPGLTMTEIPNAPDPAATATRRKLQLRELSRQFKGIMTGWKNDDSDREELRLLGQPLYRFESTDPEVIDGALFAFVQGTDPEILLLIEARSVNKAAPKWMYGFVRRISGGLEGHHNGKLVWEASKHPPNRDPNSTHVNLGGESI